MMTKLNQRIDRWFTTPQVNAVGRLAIYRIVFCLFYLWIMARRHVPHLGAFTEYEWNPLLVISWMPGMPSTPTLMILESLLIASLVFVMVGFYTRTATFALLLTGILAAGLRYSFGGVGHSDTFMHVYVPFIMLFYNWGNAYSVDAFLRRRAGHPIPSPKDDSWRYGWPILITALILSVLFATAVYIKVVWGSWVTDVHGLSHLLVTRNFRVPANPINPFLADNAFFHVPMHMIALVFELTFPLALVSRTWRKFYFSAAILFHVANHVLLDIHYVRMYIIYAIVVDWQALAERLWPAGVNLYEVRLSTRMMTTGVVILALIIGFSWGFMAESPFRWLFSLVPLPVLIWGSGVFALYGFYTACHELYQMASVRFAKRTLT